MTSSGDSHTRSQNTDPQNPDSKNSGSGSDSNPKIELKLVKSETQDKSASLNPFIQITSVIHEHTKAVSRWIGIAAYRIGVQKQKKSHKFRKGSIIDRRVD
jgi:hypothetical protein